jgi:DnaJ-like protein
VESLYAILQVDPAAEPEVIESAYRRLARKYHPDVNRSMEADARMRAINQAYAMLSDPRARALHDRQRHRAWVAQRLSSRPLHAGELGVRHYRAAVEPVMAEAADALRGWAGEWVTQLESFLSGDIGCRHQVASTGQRCLLELTDSLARWEALVPPPSAARLGELGATCLRLELALVRGGLICAEEADFSVLQPLARLADRIAALSRTIAAELAWLDRNDPRA